MLSSALIAMMLWWGGGSQLPLPEYKHVVAEVVQIMCLEVGLPIEAEDFYTRLLLETTCAESDFGKYTSQLQGGVALGVLQIEPSSYKDLYTHYFTSQNTLAIKDAIEQFYNQSQSVEDNLKFNIRYQLAVAFVIYYRRISTKSFKHLDSVYTRAAIWKKYYNTFRGAGTLRKYVDKTNYYLVNVQL